MSSSPAPVARGGQTREADGAPFILHPRELAGLLAEAGASDDLIAAGALHDVIEKTTALASDVRERFGAGIAGLVLAVSEDHGIAGYVARKADLRAKVAVGGEQALMLLAADGVSNVRELRLSPPADSTATRRRLGPGRQRARRLAHYQACLRLLEERLPGSSLVSLLAEELSASGARGVRLSRAGARSGRRLKRPGAAAKRPLMGSPASSLGDVIG
jgi:HD domain-containing protein